MLARIRTEGLEHSQVVPVFDMLTVNIGPRLTASPAHKRAAEWARDRLASYGLENAHLEPWKFGRGWTLEKLTIEMVEPRYLPLIGYADGWSASTSGEIVAAPVVDRRQDAGGSGSACAAAEGRDRHDAAGPQQLRAQGSAAAQRARLRADVGRLRDVSVGRADADRRRSRDAAAAEPAHHRGAEGGRRRRDPQAEHRRARHGLRHRPRRRSGRGADGHAERRALQHDRALPGAEHPGEAARQRADEVLRRRSAATPTT